MRKVKLQMQVSIDGFVAGPAGEMDWMVWDWDQDLMARVSEITERIDCILLGRKLAEGFVPAWESRVANPETVDAGAKKMLDTPKIVFSTTLTTSHWNNTVLAQDSPEIAITNLKQQPGQDIIVYGGGSFAAHCIRHGLIDDLHLFVNPTALGNGLSIFPERARLKLAGSRSFSCGIVELHYQPAHTD